MMRIKSLTAWLLCLVLLAAILCPAVGFAAEEGEGEAQGPTIISTTPEDGAVGLAPMGLEMEVTFSTTMDTESLSTASITSEPAAIAAVVPDPTASNRCKIYFSALDLNTEYTVIFSRQVRAQNGDRMARTEVAFRTTAQHPQYHQIVNGDMEEGTPLGIFELSSATTKVIHYEKEGDNTVLQFDPGWSGAGVGQHVYLEPGKTYEVRAKVKSTTSQIVRLIMSFVTESGGSSNWWHSVTEKNMTAGEWVEMSGSISIPDDISYDYNRIMRITAQNINQTIFIDDWQFYEAGYDVPRPQTAGSSSQTTQTVVSDEKNESMDRMIGLGIYDGAMRDKADSYVTRIDAALVFGRILGISSMDSLTNSFADLAGVRNRGIAQALKDMGIMQGYGSYFYPYNSISQREAMESLANIMGYDVAAREIGYESVFARLKLDRGISAEEGGVTYTNLAKIISNALDSDIMAAQAGGGYAVVQGQTMLRNSMGITEHEGIIAATEYSDLYGERTATDGHIIIDGVCYRVTGNTFGWEGRRVRYFVKEEQGEQWIVYIYGMNSLNQTMILDWKDIIGYANDQYTYYDEKGRERRVRVSSDKSLIYNGAAVNSYSPEDLVASYGTVQLIDNDLNGGYDVIRVEDFDTYAVHAIDYSQGIIYDEYENKSVQIDLSGKLLIEENGTPAQFSAITTGTVVSVAKSKDGAVARLLISREIVEGSVGAVLDRNGDQELALYDVVHGSGAAVRVLLHPFYAGAKDRESFMGRDVVISLDYAGRAVTFDLGQSTWTWAYLIDANLKQESFTSKLYLKVYTEANERKIYPCRENVNVNGSCAKEAGNILPSINGGAEGVVPQLLQIRTNPAGEISEILSAADPGGRLTRCVEGVQTQRYFTASLSLGGQVCVASGNTDVFSVPSSNVAQAPEYQFVHSTASAWMINDKDYTFEAYSTDGNDMTAEAIVLKDQTVRASNTWLVGVVAEIAQTLDDNGERITSMLVQNAGSNYNAVIYPDRFDLNNLSGASTGTGLSVEVGDVVAYQNDSQTRVVNLNVLYTRRDDTLYTGSTTFNSKYHVVRGKVTAKQDGYIQIQSDSTNTVYNTAVFSRILGMDKRNQVYVATEADIYDIDCGSNASDVLAVSVWGANTLILVYEPKN